MDSATFNGKEKKKGKEERKGDNKIKRGNSFTIEVWL